MRTKINGISLNCESSGKGFPLVLTHGLGGDLASWAPIVPRFAQHYRVITWDVRGHGDSDKPEGDYSASLFARDLSLLLKKLGASQAHILGISMGGVVAQRFALDYPKMVKALVLVSTSSQVGERATKAWEGQIALVEQGGMAALAQGGPSRGYSAKYLAEHAQEIADGQKRQLRNDPKAYIKAVRAIAAYNWTQELNRLTCPTLIIQGEDDTLTPPGGSVIMHRNIPGSQLLMVKECGHAITTEKPEVLINATLDFLSRHSK